MNKSTSIFIISRSEESLIIKMFNDGNDARKIALKLRKPYTAIRKCLIENNRCIDETRNKTINNSKCITFIENKISEFYKIPIKDIYQKSRDAYIVRPRQMIHMLSYELTRCSLKYIGERCGSKNHATVLNSIKKMSNFIETDMDILGDYLTLYDKCFNDIKTNDNKILFKNIIDFKSQLNVNQKVNFNYLMNKMYGSRGVLKTKITN